MKNNQSGFTVFLFALIIALGGAFASGALAVKGHKLVVDKAAAAQAFKSGKSSDWAGLNK